MRLRPVPLLLLLLGACSAPSSDAPDGGARDAGSAPPDAGFVLPADPTLDDLATFWDTRRCWVYACVNHERVTPETCARAAAADAFPFDAFTRTQAAIAAGRGTYDAVAGSQCGELLAALDPGADCYGPAAPYPPAAERLFDQACGDLLRGAVAHGGACARDAECVAGGVCRFDYDPSSSCVGTCVVWLHPGDDCSVRRQDCEPRTSYCDGASCKARTLKHDGEVCFDPGECESGKCFNYHCTAASDYQGECITDDDCLSFYYCRALPASTGMQGACEVGSPPELPCGYALKCAGNQVCAGYSRKYRGGTRDGVCRPHASGVGEPCVPIADGYDVGDTGCFAELTCDPTTLACAEAPAVGSACAMPGARCGLDAWCDAAGVCRAKKADGEAATTDAECLHDFDGFAGKCVDRAAGAACSGRF